MTAFDRIERRMPEVFDDLAAASIPDYFDDMLRQTARTRQRPAWSAFERWLPMGVIARPLPIRPMPWRVLAAAALIVMLAVSAALYVASRPRALPPPFGLAANGRLYYANPAGDILSVDPPSFQSTVAIGGHNGYVSPLPSRDGRSLLFWKPAGSWSQALVSNADGSDVRTLDGEYFDISGVGWSPDDKEVAVLSTLDDVSILSVLPMDGSRASVLKPGLDVHDFSYLPDGRILFVGSSLGAPSYGPYVMNRDGSKVTALAQPTSNELDWSSLALSPDGTHAAYHVWRDPIEHGRLYTLDIATGVSSPVDIADRPFAEWQENPQYSPDGNTLLYARGGGTCCRSLAVAPVSGGPAADIGPILDGDSGEVASTLFSPDGKSLVAYYPQLKQHWLLDPNHPSDPGRQLAFDTTQSPTWQRVAP